MSNESIAKIVFTVLAFFPITMITLDCWRVPAYLVNCYALLSAAVAIVGALTILWRKV